ncbi:hypothetical protein ANO14919_129640 [Xylariales sp. No.14919]|nr:hypothetical protein ANO14919_129640 [Xylariales sp. No.14919]
MASFRSASGPGSLSINTSSANMFGSTAGQAPASGGLFGSAQQPANASTPKPGGLFGASTTTTPNLVPTRFPTTTTPQPQQTTTLFGSTAPAQPQQQQTSGLFGATANTPSQPTPQRTTGLFGATAAAPPQQQPQQQQTSGLFGATATAPSQPAPQRTTGLFGATLTQPQPTGGLFGTANAASQAPQQRPGLFGVGQQTQNQPSGLGQSQQPQPAAGFGGSLGFGLTMGQPNAQPTVPGVRIDLTNLKGTTRFNDLQEDLQKVIEKADCFIMEQIRRKEEVDSFMSGHRQMLETIPDDVTFVSRKYDGARNALESAAQSIEAARILVNQDADSARLSFRAIDNLKLPQQYHTSGFWSPRQQASGNANAETDGQDLVGFFSKAADEMGEQMKKYERNLTEIELHMHGVSDSLVEQLQQAMAAKNSGSSGADARIQELVGVLRDFEQGILKVAGDVGSAREGMTRLQVGDFMTHDRDTTGVY